MRVWRSRITLALVALLALPQAGMALEPVISGTVRVIDGDTLDVGGIRIRLHGIDAPERNQTCETGSGTTWSCGAWVTAELKAQFSGSKADCAPVELDRYGRTVARCSAKGEDIGGVLVRSGLAFAYRRYSSEYVAAERAAQRARIGLHGQKLEQPAAFRNRTAATTEMPKGCVIKGNISASGRIFHQPGQRDYEQTRISVRKGERWFCSAAEARAAGWRAAKR